MTNNETGEAIGSSLRDLRENMGLTAKQLAKDANVSAAMISRIEAGLVSPSISTLTALSKALDVPLISLFRDTATDHVSYTHVKAGEGMMSTRMINGHSHEYINLTSHIRHDLQFETHMVTMLRQNDKPPSYVSHGVVFMHVLDGEAIFTYGPKDIILQKGDSLTLDAELTHGFAEVISSEFKFLAIKASRR